MEHNSRAVWSLYLELIAWFESERGLSLKKYSELH